MIALKDCPAVWSIGIGSSPSDPTDISYDVLVDPAGARSITVTLDGTGGMPAIRADMGQMVFVKSRAYNNKNEPGPLYEISRRRGDTRYVPIRVRAQATRSSTTVTVTVEVDDPSLAAFEPEFKRRKGQPGETLDGGWSDVWSSETGTPGTDKALTRTQTIPIDDGLDGEFLWRVRFTNENGDTDEIGDGFYLSNLQDLTKTIRTPAAAFVPAGSTGAQGYYLQPLTAGVVLTAYAGVILPRGAEATEVRLRAALSSVASGDEVVLGLHEVTDGSVTTTVSTVFASSSGDGTQTTADACSETIGAEAYVFIVQLTGTGSPNDAQFYWAEVDYDVPSYEFTI